MAYCVKCGAKVEDDVRFCPYCGGEIPRMEGSRGSAESDSDGAGSYTYYQKESYEQQYHQYDGPYYQNDSYSNAGNQGEYFEAEEVKRNKLMGVISYLGILVLIPLLAGDKRSAYVRHHANQGLVLFVLSSIVDLLDGKWIWGFHSWINFGGSWFSWIVDIADFSCLILLIMGIVSACRGTTRELPIIGKIKVFK